jgi:hypothetical protein
VTTEFLQKVCKEIAKACITEHPDNSWKDYTPTLKEEITALINKRLAAENVPTVDEDVVDWKMHALIRDTLRAKAKEKKRRDKTKSISCPPPSAATIAERLHRWCLHIWIYHV